MRNNRKKTNAYLKLAMIILISAAAGAVFGFAMFWFVGGGEAEPAIRSVYSWMQTASLPVMAAITVLAVAAGEIYIRKLKDLNMRMLHADDEECDALDYEEEKTGAVGMNISILVQGLAFVFLSFGYSTEYLGISDAVTRRFLITCILFIICTVYEGFWQVRYVKAIQIGHPYMKKADPSSRKFQKQWIDCCDEAEKEMIYQSSYRTYMILNQTIPFLILITMLCHLFFQTGILAVLAVAAIWLLVSFTYTSSCVSVKRKKIER